MDLDDGLLEIPEVDVMTLETVSSRDAMLLV
jgi:hypothetical protein